MTETVQMPNISRTLSSVPYEQGFHFYAKEGDYTGVTATSLAEFASKLETIDVNSVIFHYSRGDFQRWIEDIIGDKELADRMRFVKTGISGEKLRKQLSEMTQNRLKELRKLSV